MELKKHPKLIIAEAVWDKIMFLTRNADNYECSGFGMLQITEDQDFLVTETFMVEQVNAAAETEMTADGIGKAMFLARNKPGLFKFHWHSHVDMGTFWSGTDHEMIYKNSRHGWFVHLVVNKKGERKACIAQQDPFPFMIDDIETRVIGKTIPKEVTNAWNDEYVANVKRKTYEHHHWKGSQPVSLPGSEPYGDSLNRHASPGRADEPAGSTDHLAADSGPSESEAGDATELATEEVISALEDRLGSIKRRLVVIDGELELAGQDSIVGGELKAEWFRLTQASEDIEDNLEMLYYQLLSDTRRSVVPTIVRGAEQDVSFQI